MRALTADTRLNSIRCVWDGNPNASASRMDVNGQTVRRNLFSNPSPVSTTSFRPDSVTISKVSGEDSPTGNWIRAVPLSTVAPGNLGIGPNVGIVLPPSLHEIHVSMWVKCSQSTRFGARYFYIRASDGAAINAQNHPYQKAVLSNTPERMMVEGIPIIDGVSAVRVRLVNVAGAGSSIWDTDTEVFMGALSTSVDVPYFDGYTKGRDLMSLYSSPPPIL